MSWSVVRLGAGVSAGRERGTAKDPRGTGRPGFRPYRPRVPESTKRFPDGAQCRVEIPSIEGPDVLDAVLAEADARGVPLHGVSQGSGALLLTDAELARMAATAAGARWR